MSTARGRIATVMALLSLATPLAAQFGDAGVDGNLRPTADTTLVTTARVQGWDFVDIRIPAGVTVHLVGDHPAILRSMGAIVIDGRIEADGRPGTDQAPRPPGAGGPGGFDGGAPAQSGQGPAGGGVMIRAAAAISNDCSVQTAGLLRTNPYFSNVGSGDGWVRIDAPSGVLGLDPNSMALNGATIHTQAFAFDRDDDPLTRRRCLAPSSR